MVYMIPSFNFVGITVHHESVMNLLYSNTQYIHLLSKCVLSFYRLGLTVPEKSVTKFSSESMTESLKDKTNPGNTHLSKRCYNN